MRYFTASLSQPSRFKSGKTFTQKSYFWYKMRRLQNLEKNLPANTGGTLCQSFKISSGTITRITWSKSRKKIWQFSVHFWSFGNSYAEKKYWAKIKFSKVILKSLVFINYVFLHFYWILCLILFLNFCFFEFFGAAFWVENFFAGSPGSLPSPALNAA